MIERGVGSFNSPSATAFTMAVIAVTASRLTALASESARACRVAAE
jgi:hypothetical protein